VALKMLGGSDQNRPSGNLQKKIFFNHTSNIFMAAPSLPDLSGCTILARRVRAIATLPGRKLDLLSTPNPRCWNHSWQDEIIPSMQNKFLCSGHSKASGSFDQ
jgi:hypothetical protein